MSRALGETAGPLRAARRETACKLPAERGAVSIGGDVQLDFSQEACGLSSQRMPSPRPSPRKRMKG